MRYIYNDTYIKEHNKHQYTSTWTVMIWQSLEGHIGVGCFRSDRSAVSCVRARRDTKLVTVRSPCVSVTTRGRPPSVIDLDTPWLFTATNWTYLNTFKGVKSYLNWTYKVDVIAHKTLDALCDIVAEIRRKTLSDKTSLANVRLSCSNRI